MGFCIYLVLQVSSQMCFQNFNTREPKKYFRRKKPKTSYSDLLNVKGLNRCFPLKWEFYWKKLRLKIEVINSIPFYFFKEPNLI